MQVGYLLECIQVTTSNTLFPAPLKAQPHRVLVSQAGLVFPACLFRTVCERQAHTIAPRRIGSVIWWHRRHRHVPTTDTTHHIPEHFPLDAGSGCRGGVSPSRSWRAPVFFKTARHVKNHRPVHVFGKQIQWVDRACYLGLTADKQPMWSSHINQVGKWAARRLSMLVPFLIGEADCLSKAVLWFISRSIVLWSTTLALSGSLLPVRTSGTCRWFQSKRFDTATDVRCYVGNKFTRFCEFRCLLTKSEH